MTNDVAKIQGLTANVNAADVILAAASSALGIAALVTLVLGILTYGLFRGSSDRYKLIAFVMLLAGAGMLVSSILSENYKKEVASTEKDTTSTPGGPATENKSPVDQPNRLPSQGNTTNESAGKEEVPPAKKTEKIRQSKSETSTEAKRTVWSLSVPPAEREGWDGVIFECAETKDTLRKTEELMKELKIEILDVAPAHKGSFDSNTILYLSPDAAKGGTAFAAMLGGRLNQKVIWAEGVGNGADPKVMEKRLLIYLVGPGCESTPQS